MEACCLNLKYETCVLTLVWCANQWSWQMFKQLNYWVPFNCQESEFELFRENFKFDMWEM